MRVLKMASAFVGIIVGAGFASGQEVLQYFTSFGLLGIAGAFAATVMFAYFGMLLTWMGSRLKAESHREVVYQICGRYVGIAVDIILICTLFGVGVVMLAGAGSNLHQQFGVPPFIGSLFMVILVFVAVLSNLDKVITIIGAATPFLMLAVVGTAVYCIATIEEPFITLNAAAQNVPTNLPNWYVSALNYVSFNIAVGASMALVMGGAEKDEKTAKRGGFLGGLALGVMILLSHLAIFAKVRTVADAELPMLAIINSISPVFAILMAVILYGMIFNTAVGMFFALGARFVEAGTKKFTLFVGGLLAAGFALSFVGFTKLVAYFYPFIGYLGLLLVSSLLVARIRMKKSERYEFRR